MQEGKYQLQGLFLGLVTVVSMSNACRVFADSVFVGRCVDRKGEPVSEVKVFPLLVVKDAEGNESSTQCSPCRTDVAGEFALPIVDGAVIELAIYPEGLATTFVRFQPNPLGTQEIVLREGIHVRGTVRDPQGAPLVGYCVVAKEVGTESTRSIPLAVAVKTDEMGRFVFSPLYGTYEISVWSRFYPWKTEEPLISPRPMYSITPHVQVFQDGTKNVEIHLESTPSILVSGALADANGNPVAGHQVAAFSTTGRLIDSVKTGTKGLYCLSGISASFSKVKIVVIGILGNVDADGTMLQARPKMPVNGPVSHDGALELTLHNKSIRDVNFQFAPFTYASGFLAPYSPSSMNQSVAEEMDLFIKSDIAQSRSSTVSLLAFTIGAIFFVCFVRFLYSRKEA